MATLEEIVSRLDSLTAESLAELDSYIEYLRWKQSPVFSQPPGRPWSYDFVEHFRHATLHADQDPVGMEVRVGEATCDGLIQMALWQHPPVQGSAHVEYQVPVPSGARQLRIQFATGIRDGAHLTEGNLVAFRLLVNDWQIWSQTQQMQKWKTHEVEMPALRGDIARIQFVTDGLGNHQWAWAVWGEPRLLGVMADEE